MLFLLFLPVVGCVALLWRYLQIYALSNVLIRQVRVAAPRWRTVVALAVLAVMLLVAMHAVAQAVEHGAPAWLNLVVLTLAWDGIKVALLAIATAVRAIAGGARRLIRHGSPQARPAS